MNFLLNNELLLINFLKVIINIKKKRITNNL